MIESIARLIIPLAEHTLTFTLANDTAAKASTAAVAYLIPRSLGLKESVFQKKEAPVAISGDRRMAITLPPGSLARVAVDLEKTRQK